MAANSKKPPKNPFENFDTQPDMPPPEGEPNSDAEAEANAESQDSVLDFNAVANVREGASGNLPLTELPDPQSSPSLVSWTEVIRQHRETQSSPGIEIEPVQVDAVSDKDLLKRIVAEEQARQQSPPAGERDTDILGDVPLVTGSSVQLTNDPSLVGPQPPSGSTVKFDVLPTPGAGGIMQNPWANADEDIVEGEMVDEDFVSHVPLAEAVDNDEEPSSLHLIDQTGTGDSLAKHLSQPHGSEYDFSVSESPSTADESSILEILLEDEKTSPQAASGVVDIGSKPDSAFFKDEQIEQHRAPPTVGAINLPDADMGAEPTQRPQRRAPVTAREVFIPEEGETPAPPPARRAAPSTLAGFSLEEEPVVETGDMTGRARKGAPSTAAEISLPDPLQTQAQMGSLSDIEKKGGRAPETHEDITLQVEEQLPSAENLSDIAKKLSRRAPSTAGGIGEAVEPTVKPGSGWFGSAQGRRTMPSFEVEDEREASVNLYQERPVSHGITDSGSLQIDEEEMEAEVRRRKEAESSSIDLGSEDSTGSLFSVDVSSDKQHFGATPDETVDMSLPESDPGENSSMIRQFDLAEEEESLKEFGLTSRPSAIVEPMDEEVIEEEDEAPRQGKYDSDAFPSDSEIVEGNEAPDEPPPTKRTATREPSGKKGGGMAMGALLGLVVGAGGMFGAYYADLLPASTDGTTPIVKKDGEDPGNKQPVQPIVQAQAPTPQLARQMLESGNPAKSVEYFAKLDQESPAVLAGSGQAKWLVVLQSGKVPAKEDADAALQDLQAAVEKAKGDDNAEAEAARAYLWQGLIAEQLGDFEKAEKIYTDASGEMKVPANKALFTTALNRLQVVKPAQGMPIGAIAPEHLFLAMTLFLADEPGVPPSEEAGHIFWEAMGLAVKHDYARAAAKIPSVKIAHQKQRLAMAGRGLNPTSDPREEILIIALNEMENYWKLADQLYKRPESKTLVEQKKITEALAAALAGSKDDGQMKLVLEKLMVKPEQKVLEVIDEVLKARKEAEEGKKVADEMLVAVNKALKDAGIDDPKIDEGIKKLATGKADAEGKVKAVADALDKAGVKDPDVAKALAAIITSRDDADSIVKGVRERLEKAKYVEANAARDVVFKAIDEAIIRGSGDALTKLADEKKVVETKLTKLEGEVATIKKESTDNVTKAKQDADAMVDKIKKEAADQKTMFEAKLANSAKDFVDSVAKANGLLKENRYDAALQAYIGGTKTLSLPKDLEDVLERILSSHPGLAKVDLGPGDMSLAQKHYNQGLEFYRVGSFDKAEQEFGEAIRFDNKDARYAYFQGLARWRQGKNELAINSFKTAATLESMGRPVSKAVSSSLESIQGDLRSTVERYRP